MFLRHRVFLMLQNISSSSIRAGVYRQSVSIFTPVCRITPIDTTATNNYYTINNRVDNLTGIYVDNSTTYYTDVTIVDETNNKYYDMTTKTYYDIRSRGHTIAPRGHISSLLDNDVALTVQFGDTNVTITNNNVSNTYNYVVEDDTGSDRYTHRLQARLAGDHRHGSHSCLEGGHASHLPKCGVRPTSRSSPPKVTTGRSLSTSTWSITRMAPWPRAQTLYQCSVCGEQWYTDTGAPPPGCVRQQLYPRMAAIVPDVAGGKVRPYPGAGTLDAILAQLQDTSGSATCEHTYSQHMEQEATCILPGLQVSTCSQCGDSYSKSSTRWAMTG